VNDEDQPQCDCHQGPCQKESSILTKQLQHDENIAR
jgi:hypothetical protein